MYKDSIFIEESEKLINSSLMNDEIEDENGIKISKITIDAKTAKNINRSKGRYITITYNKETAANVVENIIDTITKSFEDLFEYMKIPKKKKVLFVGLGNKDVTSDKFGYLTIEKIEATNKTYKIYKDTQGSTNINSVDFTRALSELLEPDLVVVFDALKAEHITRLGNTIQLSTAGMYPGSALSNKLSEISKKTIKTNVICLGIPTIINMKDITDNNPDLLVSSKDIDKVVDNMSSLLSIVINRLF